MELFFYRDDLEVTPRETENSRVVVIRWRDKNANYAVEDPAGDANYLRIVGERGLFRRILGLGALEDAHFQQVASARIFGEDGPALADFLAPGVFTAMAFVPLTPPGQSGRPYLARLYCARGLSKRFAPDMEGADSEALQPYSFFLSGVPAKELVEGVEGRSWLLAAYLLARIVQERDTATARGLATRFVVTGDVVGDQIRKVRMLRKVDLAQQSQLASLKWIIPMENEMDIMNSKVLKVSSLEEARELIKSMQNRETRALMKMAEKGSSALDAMLELLSSSADASATDAESGENAHQRLLNVSDGKIYDCLMRIYGMLGRRGEKIDPNGELRNLMDGMCEELEARDEADRVLSCYAGSPQMFFFLAKMGDGCSVANLAKVYDINATDGRGETALDLAKKFKESQAVSILVENGAVRRGVYEPMCWEMLRLLKYSRLQGLSTDDLSYLKTALDNGYSPNAIVDLAGECCRRSSWTTWKPVYHSGEEYEEDHVDSPEFNPEAEHDGKTYSYQLRCFQTTLLMEAIASQNEELIDACFAHGGDLNTKVTASLVSKLAKETFARSQKGPDVSYEVVFRDEDFRANEKSMSILDIMNTDGSLGVGVRRLVKDCQKKYALATA